MNDVVAAGQELDEEMMSKLSNMKVNNINLIKFDLNNINWNNFNLNNLNSFNFNLNNIKLKSYFNTSH